jgi:hypothetical protein
VVESVLLWVGLALAAAVALARAWMATGRPLAIPPRARTIGSWLCLALGALYMGSALGEAVRHEPAGALAIEPHALGVALLMASLAGFYAASWHLALVLGEEEQARRAGDRAQRAVLLGLRALGVDPALRGSGRIHWAATAERLEAGLVAGVFIGSELARASRLYEHCRVLAESTSVVPLKLRAVDAPVRHELADLQQIANPRAGAKTPSRR